MLEDSNEIFVEIKLNFKKASFGAGKKELARARETAAENDFETVGV